MGQAYVLTPPPKCYILTFKTVVGQLCKFHIVNDERIVSKMEGKTILGAYRLPGTGIIEYLKIIDVRYHMAQFDGLT